VEWENSSWHPETNKIVFGEDRVNGLDMVAHEFTHGVNQYSCDLTNHHEAGTLNEAFCDFFASRVDRDDWTIGEDIPDGPIRSLDVQS